MTTSTRRPLFPKKQLSTAASKLLLASLLLLLTANLLHAQNWTRFRGKNGTGISHQKGIPTQWSPGDFAWNIELPGMGHSAPVIWEDDLFITSAIKKGAVRYLFCIDPATGEKKWSRMIGLSRSHKHRKNSWASSTPATDGERVYVAFADAENYTLAAYDFDGNLVWRRNLGSFESQHGQGVSPIVFEDMVILPNDQKGPSSIIAVDRKTGETRWSVLRSFRETAYSTPIVIEHEGGQPQLICVSGAMGITSLDPYTGKLNWLTGEFPLRTVASPVYAEGLVIASCGGAGVGKLMIAVEPTGEGNVSQSHVQWERDRILPYVPTPIVHDGHLFLWNDNGVVTCVDIQTGQSIWTKRVGGNFSGSPICIDGKLYCISEDGDVIVVAASPEYHLYGKTALGDPSHSTPAVANGRLFLRTYHRLMCLEAKQ